MPRFPNRRPDLRPPCSPAMYSRILVVSLSIALGLVIGVVAQNHSAQCLPGWDWVRDLFLEVVGASTDLVVAEQELSRSRSMSGSRDA